MSKGRDINVNGVDYYYVVGSECIKLFKDKKHIYTHYDDAAITPKYMRALIMRVTKGLYDCKCNRSACQSEGDTHWYNRSTDAYYCGKCVKLIEQNSYNKGIHTHFPKKKPTPTQINEIYQKYLEERSE